MPMRIRELRDLVATLPDHVTVVVNVDGAFRNRPVKLAYAYHNAFGETIFVIDARKEDAK